MVCILELVPSIFTARGVYVVTRLESADKVLLGAVRRASTCHVSAASVRAAGDSGSSAASLLTAFDTEGVVVRL